MSFKGICLACKSINDFDCLLNKETMGCDYCFSKKVDWMLTAKQIAYVQKRLDLLREYEMFRSVGHILNVRPDLVFKIVRDLNE